MGSDRRLTMDPVDYLPKILYYWIGLESNKDEQIRGTG